MVVSPTCGIVRAISDPSDSSKCVSMFTFLANIFFYMP